jgi:2-methylisocitrate lyase-like PEP mutase family enzyme
MDRATPQHRAAELLRLHSGPELLVLVNVWDVASARLVAADPACRVIATASHSVAAMFGYDDGEQIPLDLVIDLLARIAAAVDVPVTADLEAGYGDAGETVRRPIGAGAVGGNLEDQMAPLPDAVAAVEAAVRAGEAEGVPFVLNARTDAFLIGTGDSDQRVTEAVARGRAFLDAGAACVFVPGASDVETVGRLVEGIGERKVSLLGLPGSPPPAEWARLGVARVSYGPFPHRLALAALVESTSTLLSGGGLPARVPRVT